MRVIVVGGGIGGLTAALALLRAGHEVRVDERAAGFGEIGAGVQLGPNATRVLHGLGLDAALRRTAFSPVATRFLRWEDDTVLTEWPLAGHMEARFGAPYYTVYRPDLITVLAAALPAGVVCFGKAVTAVESWHPRPLVRFADGTAATADVVVGADGIHSAVRGATVAETAARFSGMCAYRALVPADALSAEPAVRVWLGPNRHLVAYPVGRFVNLVCVVPATDWPEESWTAPGSLAELRAAFRGWSRELNDLLGHVREPVYRWGLYDREPLPRWSTATTTLVGDACHPMLPFLAQGGAQAIEDGAALAAALDGDLAPALARYEARRRPHTARIQRRSWDNNVDYHLPDGPAQRRRDAALAAGEGMNVESLSWIYGNDAGR
ncbi:FAD-dependent monooxygenase [Amycolatopsis sacchari]|uniref:FAD-dependent monooxygenase n=1 Tax=Amycolatopsis sacchari TaxID=115433 RepID=UPI003D754F65